MEEKKSHKKGTHKTQSIDYRKDALSAAKDLCYGPKIISEILNAKSDTEIERIMNTARKSSR